MGFSHDSKGQATRHEDEEYLHAMKTCFDSLQLVLRKTHAEIAGGRKGDDDGDGDG
jgi:hypothetical protein